MYTLPHSSHLTISCGARVDIEYFLSLAFFFKCQKRSFFIVTVTDGGPLFHVTLFPTLPGQCEAPIIFVLVAEGWVGFLLRPKGKGNDSWSKPSQHPEVVLGFCHLGFFIFMFCLFGVCCYYITSVFRHYCRKRNTCVNFMTVFKFRRENENGKKKLNNN